MSFVDGAIALEELPPFLGDGGDRELHFARLECLLRSSLDHVFIPEIVPEHDESGCVVGSKRREDSLRYALDLRSSFGVSVVPYRVVSHRTRSENELWFRDVCDAGIDKVVIVGSFDKSPVSSVLRMNELAVSYGLNVGNIVIPTRRDEPDSVRAKV